jgi:hypothetical protein
MRRSESLRGVTSTISISSPGLIIEDGPGENVVVFLGTPFMRV